MKFDESVMCRHDSVAIPISMPSVAEIDAPRLEIAGHYCAGADGDTLTDRHSGQYNAVRAKDRETTDLDG